MNLFTIHDNLIELFTMIDGIRIEIDGLRSDVKNFSADIESLKTSANNRIKLFRVDVAGRSIPVDGIDIESVRKAMNEKYGEHRIGQIHETSQERHINQPDKSERKTW